MFTNYDLGSRSQASLQNSHSADKRPELTTPYCSKFKPWWHHWPTAWWPDLVNRAMAWKSTYVNSSLHSVTMVRVIHVIVPQFGSGRTYFIGKIIHLSDRFSKDTWQNLRVKTNDLFSVQTLLKILVSIISFVKLNILLMCSKIFKNYELLLFKINKL